MKVFNPVAAKELSSTLEDELQRYRNSRGFIPETVLEAKIQRINEYFRQYQLSTAVVAVSGGIDSALVLALLHQASLRSNSTIRRVVPFCLPALNNVGVTGQQDAIIRATAVCDSLGLDLITMDIANHVSALSADVEAQIKITAQPWALGQLVPYFRTPVLYYLTSVLTENGQPAVVVGTINADEGQYIGYIGKASDAMVDIQPISDLHKSEVYSLATLLGVPTCILEATPTGDMFDSRVDEEVFGAPYDFIELYRHILSMPDADRKDFEKRVKEAGEKDILDKLTANVESLHRYNKHKYLGCSPSVHMDVLNTRVSGGWKYYNYGGYQ